MALACIYPPNYTFVDYELHAWKKMLKDVGCVNITPFTKKESQVYKSNICIIKL